MTTPKTSPVAESVVEQERIDAWLSANCGTGLPYVEATDDASMLHGLAYVLRQIEGNTSYKVHIGQSGPAASAIRRALEQHARAAIARTALSKAKDTPHG